MRFEWDDEKSRTNKAKHDIDFDTAKELWDDPNRVEILTSYPLENRSILIGKIDKTLWTAIFTRPPPSLTVFQAPSGYYP